MRRGEDEEERRMKREKEKEGEEEEEGREEEKKERALEFLLNPPIWVARLGRLSFLFCSAFSLSLFVLSRVYSVCTLALYALSILYFCSSFSPSLF